MTEQIDKNRFATMGECYDQMALYLVPRYDFLQEEVLALALDEGVVGLVVDLGAGSGRFLEKALSAAPSAQAVWVDSSQDFLSVARRRLAPFGQRVRFILCALEDPWEDQIGGRPDAIFSMSAIHHLESDQKRRLYQRCLTLLRPGGWFFNADEMSTFFGDAYRQTLGYWVRHVERMRSQVPADKQGYYSAWCERFEKWKERNVRNAAAARQRGDDIHEGFAEQVHWMRDLGYANVDLFMKFQLWSVIGGQKPRLETLGGVHTPQMEGRGGLLG